MRRSFLPFLLPFAVVPVIAFALTIEPGSLYKDVRQSSPEAAGINMLSREGAIQGYGNGLFGPSRLINRAEFLKIVMQMYIFNRDNGFSGYDWYKNGKVPPEGCFPDVTLHAWFGGFVCEAYDAGFVRGNPDGLFHPERTVNYAEALKMLTLVYGYEIPSVESGDWPEPYYRVASLKQVDLPITIRFDTPLTRGLAARLIAAFLAESKGQLATFRLAEAGEYLPAFSVSSSSSSSSSSSLSSLSSSSSSSSISSASSFTLPPVSHFLVLGKSSDAVASITLRSPGDIAQIMSAQVKLFNEVTALDTLELVNVKTGESVVVLKRRTTTDIPDYKLTYEVQVPLELQKEIPADTDTVFALRANIRGVDNNGSSEQLLHLRTLSVTIRGKNSTESTNVPALGPFPKHQTSFGRVVKVERVTPSTGTLVSGTAAVVSTFSVTSEMLPGKTFGVEHALLSLTRTGQVSAKNWRVNQVGSSLSIPCSQSQDLLQISCENLGSIGLQQTAAPLQFEFRADIFAPSGSTGNSVQVDLQSVGSPEAIGSIQWTDGSGHFKWIEGESPIVKGTKWQ